MTDPDAPVKATHFEDIAELFTIYMVLDQKLNVVLGSETLIRYLPVVAEQPSVLEVFNFTRPRAISSFDQARNHLSSLFLLTAIDGSFAVRGQLLRRVLNGEEYLVFCGSPWLSWLVENRPEVRLSLNDFSPQDVQLDQLFYMTTEKKMVEDLEHVNKQLSMAQHEAEKAHAAKSAFFAQMSHEMRTPLTGIVAALALMKERGVHGEAEELLGLASKSSDNLLQVINYVLDISKLESVAAEQKRVEFDLLELVTSVLDIVRAGALEKGLELDCCIGADVADTYIGDVASLRQSLLNLVINAVKYTDDGSVSVNVRGSGEGNERLRIEVKDSGVGIDAEFHNSIFEPFVTSGHLGQGERPQATGLGLDIARRNVQSMGGSIGVSSTPGVGSLFWMELPLPAGTPVVRDSNTAMLDVGHNMPFSGHVLLVDDNETNLKLGTMILEGMGVSVVSATSGEQAVHIATQSEVDMVLMDISMPGIDGYEATRQIRADSHSAGLPIIALTAYADLTARGDSEACGMNGHLTKPIEVDKLVEVLAGWLPQGQGVSTKLEHAHVEESAPGIDRAVLEQLLEQIGRDNLASVAGKFHHEAECRWHVLESVQDEVTLAREAHTLSSTCRSFGLIALAEMFKGIESEAKDGLQSLQSASLAKMDAQLRSGLADLNVAVQLLCK